jgi:hypothetical protein
MNGPNLFDAGLTDGVAIVTGGGRGIGRAIVEILAAAGMDVVFAYRENTVAAAEAGRADVHAVGMAALDHLGVAGDDLDARVPRRPRDRIQRLPTRSLPPTPPAAPLGAASPIPRSSATTVAPSFAATRVSFARRSFGIPTFIEPAPVGIASREGPEGGALRPAEDSGFR